MARAVGIKTQCPQARLATEWIVDESDDACKASGPCATGTACDAECSRLQVRGTLLHGNQPNGCPSLRDERVKEPPRDVLEELATWVGMHIFLAMVS